MNGCSGHEPYLTYKQASEALRRLVADAKRTGRGGKSFKRLNIWKCGDHFHIGRANQKPIHKTEKQPSAGDLRRKERHAEKERSRAFGRKARHVYAQVGYITDIEEAARRASAALKDMNENLAIARQMASRIIFVK